MNYELSVESGIEIQATHLEKWEQVLKSEVFEDLKAWATSTNNEAKTGYDIRRGNTLDNYIGNYQYYKEGKLV
jgi:hypothetical protein